MSSKLRQSVKKRPFQGLTKDFDPNRYNIHFFANVLEGLFGEYHSSSVALGNVLSCQSLLSRVLTRLLAYQVVVCRVQCSIGSGLLSTDFCTLSAEGFIRRTICVQRNQKVTYIEQ